jgi:crotonobetainyl-CoA:carnitine CoA-transferase CaiB-like acyl-CoA transferase
VSNPFEQITILSLEQATVLPYLSWRFALEGARVIRIEHPTQCDPNRRVGSPYREGEDLMCDYFLACNAGKEAITLNLKHPRAGRLLRELLICLDVDIFAANTLPKHMKSLGIGYEELSAVKPDLIWVGLTGFGPDSDEPAYDPVLQARGGVMDMTGQAEGEPQLAGVYLPDIGTANHAYGEIMKALFKRATTGEGSRIDVSMLQSTVSWLLQPITMYKTFGKVMHRRGNTHQFFVPSGVFPTTDGWIYLAMGNDLQWRRLTALPGFETLERPEWATNRGRAQNRGEVLAMVAACMRRFSTAAVLELLHANSLAAGKCNDVTEVCEDPLVARHLIRAVEEDTGFQLTMPPAPVTTEWLQEHDMTMAFPPRLGEHNERVFVQELGLSHGEYEVLRADGVI